MHQKEQVIAPLLNKAFNIVSVLPKELNTDLLGTFSGEIERKESPLEVVKRKCVLAMEETGCDIAIASEGSFGAHPTIPFVAADDELVLLIDRKNGLEIFGREVSAETNFGGEKIDSLAEALELCNRFKFPSHALIIRDQQDSFQEVYTGIQDPVVFQKRIEALIDRNGSAWVETDMRAMYNPTRMRVIEKATENLIAKMKSLCPSCEQPGFSVTKVISGLPCSLCHQPTSSTLAHTYSCMKCGYTQDKKFPHSKEFEEPMYCDFCNP